MWLVLAMVQYVIYCGSCLNEYTMLEKTICGQDGGAS